MIVVRSRFVKTEVTDWLHFGKFDRKNGFFVALRNVNDSHIKKPFKWEMGATNHLKTITMISLKYSE